MKKKRFLALILALLMSSAVFVACNDDTENESSAPSSSQTSAVSADAAESSEAEVSAGPLDHLADADLDKDIYFLVNTQTDVNNSYRSIEICPNDEDEKYSYMNESVTERNRLIEDKLGIRIREIRTTDMTGDIVNAVNSGSQDFQIVCPWMTDAGPLVASGCFYDLHTFDDIINFDKPYWDNNANESLSINNKLYFTTGDFSLLSMDVTHCMVFNRDMIAENNLENPYDLVAEGKWTLDKMLELSHAVTADTDGESGLTWKDTIGAHLSTNFANSFFIGAGERFVRKDSNDLPYISIYSERSADVVAKIKSVFDSSDTITIESYFTQSKQEGFPSCYWAARDALANKRTLFVAISLSNVIDIANNFDCRFGLLVTPKLDEQQDDYISYISVIFASCCAIPTCNQDPETAALVLEALNAASAETTKKHYYQRVLKAQKLQDEEGEQMLDTIFNNRVYDLGAIFDWGGIRDFLNSVCVDNKDMFTSKFEANRDAMESAMKDTLKFASK